MFGGNLKNIDFPIKCNKNWKFEKKLNIVIYGDFYVQVCASDKKLLS